MADTSKFIEIKNRQNSFGIKLISSLSATTDSNILVSPPGIYTSLRLIHLGASGKTHDELNDFLGDLSVRLTSKHVDGKVQQNKTDKNVVWYSENAIVYGKTNILKKSYEKSVQGYAPTLFLPLTDVSDIEYANSWIKEKTNGNIETLLSENEIDVTCLIANVNYFYGKWNNKFKKELTHFEKFFSANMSISTIKMMEAKDKFRYFKDNNKEIIELLYEDFEFSALVIFPSNNSEIEKVLLETEDTIKIFDKQSSRLFGHLLLPLFSMDNEYSLKERLREYGLKSMFVAGKANFSNMFSRENHIYVDDLKHRAILKVDEEGSEATSLTKVSFFGSLPEPMPNFEMIVNRPFIFLIRNKSTNNILYLALIRNL